MPSKLERRTSKEVAMGFVANYEESEREACGDEEGQEEEKAGLLAGDRTHGGVGKSDCTKSGSEAEARPMNSIKVVVAGTILGNVLEWYDFSVYSAFATELAANFFPEGDGASGGEIGVDGSCGGGSGGGSLLATLAVFGAAFVARPVGGILMGHIGDKWGRTIALRLSVILQGFAAIAIAILPSNLCPGCSYQVGLTGTVALILLRLLQGASVGGELVGSMIFSAETATPAHRTLLACVPLSSAYIGTATGYLVAGIVHMSLSEEQVAIWGWRLGFALGTPLAVIAMLLRNLLNESEEFHESQKQNEKHHRTPLMTVMREQKGAIFLTMLAVCLWAMGNWLTASWLRIFYTSLIKNPVSDSFGAILNFVIILFGGLFFYPVSWGADRITNGIYRTMIAGCLYVAIFSIPLLTAISLGSKCYPCVIVGHLLINVGVCIFGAPMTAWMTGNFPVALRFSSLALAYNFAQMLFGGIAPFIATAITCNVDWKPAAGVLFAGSAAVTMTAIFLAEKTWIGTVAFKEARKEKTLIKVPSALGLPRHASEECLGEYEHSHAG